MPARKPIPPGTKFARLTVVGAGPPAYISSTGDRRYCVLCQCECGKQKVVREADVRSGRTKACGCWNIEHAAQLNRSHGHTRKGAKCRTYIAWKGIFRRCFNSNEPQWKDYGGRSITVCERWRDFRNFLADMGEKPLGMTLERINNNGNYEPRNCKWATYKEQNRNKRSNRMVVFKGKHMVLAEALVLAGTNRATFYWRVNQGWPEERALNTPPLC